jgi:hypothetical protein
VEEHETTSGQRPTRMATEHPSADPPRNESQQNSGPLDSMTNPASVISAAIRAVPVVKYALGLAGVAAAASVVGAFVGSGPAAIITMAAMLLGMLFLYLVSVVTTGGEPKPLPLPAAVILWAVTLFICAMLFLFTTALAFGWPDNFARAMNLKQSIYAGLTTRPDPPVIAEPAPRPPIRPLRFERIAYVCAKAPGSRDACPNVDEIDYCFEPDRGNEFDVSSIRVTPLRERILNPGHTQSYLMQNRPDGGADWIPKSTKFCVRSHSDNGTTNAKVSVIEIVRGPDMPDKTFTNSLLPSDVELR